MAKAEASRLIRVVENTVTLVNETNVREWLSTFSKDVEFRSETGVCLEPNSLLIGYDSLYELNLENFKGEIKDGLKKLEKKLLSSFDGIQCESEMVHWKNNPHDLLQTLVGCTEQCPFCGEQCDLPDFHFGHHRTEVHRPSCLAGWRLTTTKVMMLDFCQALVDSNRSFRKFKIDNKFRPYRCYQSVYPTWSIPPDRSCEGSLFWKWFVGKYNVQLAREYDAKPAQVSKWRGISWDEVERDLESVYKL